VVRALSLNLARAYSQRSVASLAITVFAAFVWMSPGVRGETSVLVGTGSTWRYLDNGSDLGTAWRTPGFNDGAWSSGPAQLGYGDGDEATVLRYGGNASAKPITTYFRRSFSVANPSLFSTLNLRLLRDDGAVVYLNGVEMFRSNMPAGTIGYTTPASAAVTGTDETAFVSASVTPSLLVTGTNVLAVEIHQSDPTSSDISFDLELIGGSSVLLTRGPYLQIGTPNSIVVRWRTSGPAVGRVQFGPSPGVIAGSAQEASARTDHEVRLTGLSPETLYYYSIGTPTQTMAGDATFRFRTSPLPGTARATRVWVIGDSGTADANARAVRDAYGAYAGGRDTDLWLMLGDNAYNDGLDAEYQAAAFDMYSALLRKTVLWPAYGNHDGYGSDAGTNTGPYFDIFTLPKQGEAGGVASGSEAYYSFDYANMHFVCLESFETDRSPAAPMLTWLQRDLAATTQPWVIVFFHHPPYSKGSHDSDAEIELMEMRQNAVPILENFGVDLVLSGHSHSYERSFLLDGHYGTSTTFTEAMKRDAGSGRPDQSGAYTKPSSGMAPHEGAVYVVAGVSGQTGGGTLDYPAMYVSQATLGSLVLDVNGSRLDAAFVDSTGVRRDYFSIVKGSGSLARPYGGTPAPIPGVVQAEYFDEGGEGVAYHDTTTGNRGGAFRSTDVDIETTADAGGGYDIGWTKPGEWLQYTVNVTTTGVFDLMLRMASTGSGAALHVLVDDANVTGTIPVPNTGGWQTWTTVTVAQVPLTAGIHRVRLAFDANGSTGSVGNINRFELSPSIASTPYGGRPVMLPGRIEAENFDEGGQSVAYLDNSAGNRGGAYRQTDVDIETTADAGGGYDVGWTKPGEWLQYTVDVSATAEYALELRVASPSTGATLRVEVDGNDVTGTLAVPTTGAWQAWQTIPVGGIPLSAGRHAVRLVFVAAGSNGIVNVNYLSFVR
jgi:hypothetical protein